MDFEKEQQIVAEIKRYVTENLPLSKMEDDELEEKIEDIVAQKLQGIYCSIDQKVSIVQQVLQNSPQRGYYAPKWELPLNGNRLLINPNHYAYIKISDGNSN